MTQWFAISVPGKTVIQVTVLIDTVVTVVYIMCFLFGYLENKDARRLLALMSKCVSLIPMLSSTSARTLQLVSNATVAFPKLCVVCDRTRSCFMG